MHESNQAIAQKGCVDPLTPGYQFGKSAVRGALNMHQKAPDRPATRKVKFLSSRQTVVKPRKGICMTKTKNLDICALLKAFVGVALATGGTGASVGCKMIISRILLDA
ncbi:hypothetical protein BT63DRAFT_436223 [Microthyrium microscopicum]|uniref:Uncharacterized protein n=1 Tax=Microthyrium microscopicum TaxID=703497 RepID=A0A6A6UUZ2_9PEZI|nr:hypothetical protein BT63DRAFT_436223 [Microthyrium microscopicum]